MDERKRKALCDVLVERLLSGEDPDALRAQLVRELSPDEAERLIAEARERVDARRGDPMFVRSVARIRQRRLAGAGRRAPAPLHGPGLRVTAGLFGALGALVILGSLTRSVADGRPDLPSFLAGLLFAIPAAALWRSTSLAATGFLAAVCGLAWAVSTLFAITSMKDYGLSVFPIVLIWTALLAVAMRAFLIARAGHRQSIPPPMVDVFD